MTFQITIRINRWTVFAACVLCVALAVVFAPRQGALAQPLDKTAACPTPAANNSPTPRVSKGAFQLYEHGYMLWIGDKRLLYVMYFGKDINHGPYEVYPEHWEEGMPETDPAFNPPKGLLQPTRGGGLLWRENEKVRTGLGYGTFPPLGFETIVAQQGNDLWMTGADRAFTLDGDTMQWHQHFDFNPINEP